jgi:nucleotide-binding universal stress UspA family protein
VLFRRVVVGVDFEDASLVAARWVNRYLAHEAELVLAFVREAPTLPSFVRTSAARVRGWSADEAHAIRRSLLSLAELLSPGRARVELREGVTSDELARLAAEVGADLICVGRGRRWRGSARFGATTPQRLLMRSRVPVLVVAGARPALPESVLAAIDERPGGEAVPRVAVRVAAALEARLDALHVLEPDVVQQLQARVRSTLPRHGAVERDDAQRRALTGSIALGAGLDSATSAACEDARSAADAWASRLLDASGAPRRLSTSVLRIGDPAQQLLAHARRAGTGLIVVGRGGDASHERVPEGARPLGSTTRAVLWMTTCPVLVVPPDVHQSDATSPLNECGARGRPAALVRALRAPAGPRSGPGTDPSPLPPAARRRREAGPGDAA